MEESLRQAYLAAMEIPVWVQRIPEQAGVAARSEPPARAVEREAVAKPGVAQRRARDLLAELPPVAAAVEDRLPPLAPTPPRAAARGRQQAVSLVLAVVPGVLFVADAAESPPPAKLAQLLRELALVLTGRREKPAIHGFSWPPPGVAFDEKQARDAVLGRMGKLRERDAFDRVVLMGAPAASLLVGEGGTTLDVRAPGASAHPPVVCATVRTCSAARMLMEPGAKREAWRAVAAVRRPAPAAD